MLLKLYLLSPLTYRLLLPPFLIKSLPLLTIYWPD